MDTENPSQREIGCSVIRGRESRRSIQMHER
jgi:hypothetical protein